MVEGRLDFGSRDRLEAAGEKMWSDSAERAKIRDREDLVLLERRNSLVHDPFVQAGRHDQPLAQLEMRPNLGMTHAVGTVSCMEFTKLFA